MSINIRNSQASPAFKLRNCPRESWVHIDGPRGCPFIPQTFEEEEPNRFLQSRTSYTSPGFFPSHLPRLNQVSGQVPLTLSKAIKGRTVLLTGGNSGIGKEAALALARMGAEIILVSRDPFKGASAVEEIKRESGNQSVELLAADLLLQREVRKVVGEFRSNHERLDVLINNAGSQFPRYEVTEDGIERTMALNYFAPFLLTNLLMNCLGQSAPSRVVNVASTVHNRAHLDIGNLGHDSRMGMGGLDAYGRSKLALVMFTYELAKRFQGKGVTANCLHPGNVRTHIWARTGSFSPLTRLASLFMMSAEEGAKTTVYLASSPEVGGKSGGYYEKCKPMKSSPESHDAAGAVRLWELSMQMTGLAPSKPSPS